MLVSLRVGEVAWYSSIKLIYTNKKIANNGHWVMKSLIALILLMWVSYADSKTTVIVYGDDDYPPYSYTENGKITGIYTVILKKNFFPNARL